MACDIGLSLRHEAVDAVIGPQYMDDGQSESLQSTKRILHHKNSSYFT